MEKKNKVIQRTSLGTNITEDFLVNQEIRAQVEEIDNANRLAKMHLRHSDGARSALDITYTEIAKNPSVLDKVTPMDAEPNSKGEVLLWQDYAVKASDEGFFGVNKRSRGPLHRVMREANGNRRYEKFNSIHKIWTTCNAKTEDGEIIPNKFPIPRARKAKSENWEDVGESAVARSVMNAKGEVDRREYQKLIMSAIRKG